MTIIQEIADALHAQPGFSDQEPSVPQVSVHLDSEKEKRASGAPFAKEIIVRAEVLDETAQGADDLSAQTDRIMGEMGFSLQSAENDFDELHRAYRATRRYRGVVVGDTVYQ